MLSNLLLPLLMLTVSTDDLSEREGVGLVWGMSNFKSNLEVRILTDRGTVVRKGVRRFEEKEFVLAIEGKPVSGILYLVTIQQFKTGYLKPKSENYYYLVEGVIVRDRFLVEHSQMQTYPDEWFPYVEEDDDGIE